LESLYHLADAKLTVVRRFRREAGDTKDVRYAAQGALIREQQDQTKPS
jgi:hypothetical protein